MLTKRLKAPLSVPMILTVRKDRQVCEHLTRYLVLGSADDAFIAASPSPLCLNLILLKWVVEIR